MKAVLVLEDGTYFSGQSFGAVGEAWGEVVFNTSMTGYQEIISDPSYKGHIVAMTYPLMGNYGFNHEDVESYRTHVEGFIVKELCDYPNNWRNEMLPDTYFRQSNVIGIKGIDTRALAQHLRQFGSMYGIISTETGHINILLDKLKDNKLIKRKNVMEVTTNKIIHKPGNGKRVAVLDFGVKKSILQSLEERDCDIKIMPASSTYYEIMSEHPEGILISNGPGDPRHLPEAVNTIKELIDNIPILAIGLGHQLLGLALGLKIQKLRFGHHGANHPVKNLINNRCYITSQNHNYIVVDDNTSQFRGDVEITHIHVNDGSIEGFRHKRLPIISIQYHPESSSASLDSKYIFNNFLALMK